MLHVFIILALVSVWIWSLRQVPGSSRPMPPIFWVLIVAVTLLILAWVYVGGGPIALRAP